MITSAHISKGLEFDTVIVPQVDEENYANEMDKCMLYIACTRAMHELHLTHDCRLSPFLAFAEAPASGHGSVDAEMPDFHDRATQVRVG